MAATLDVTRVSFSASDKLFNNFIENKFNLNLKFKQRVLKYAEKKLQNILTFTPG